MTQTRVSGFAIVGFAYVIALVVANTTVQALPGWHPLWAIAVADVAATLTVFVFSRAFNNTSVYDPYWSLAPMPIAVHLFTSWGPRQLVVVGLVVAWGLRLTWNWVRGWPGLHHEDWRYVEFRHKTGKAYWLVSLTALHLFPTVVVWFGCLPLHGALASTAGFNTLDAVAIIITAGAVILEGVADEQLRAWRRENPAGGICDVGLWRTSRHPNYFGELSFWLGLAVFGLAAGAPVWSWAGLALMVLLFVFASIPMVEKRSLARRPQYAEHQQRVSALVPWFPKK